jgi:hypothetical protein
MQLLRGSSGETAPDTIEGHLYARPEDWCVVDPAALAELHAVPRVSPWFGYAPLDPAHLGNIDGVVYVKDTGT